MRSKNFSACIYTCASHPLANTLSTMALNAPLLDTEATTAWASVSNAALMATWVHLVRENLDVPPRERARILAITSWDQESPADWCCFVPVLTEGLRNKKRGQQKPYRRKGIIGIKGKKLGVHQLAAYVRQKRKPSPQEHASHYWCDNQHCCCPAHILFEDASLNITRYCCKRFRGVINYRCPHEPVCPQSMSTATPQQ